MLLIIYETPLSGQTNRATQASKAGKHLVAAPPREVGLAVQGEILCGSLVARGNQH